MKVERMDKRGEDDKHIWDQMVHLILKNIC